MRILSFVLITTCLLFIGRITNVHAATPSNKFEACSQKSSEEISAYRAKDIEHHERLAEAFFRSCGDVFGREVVAAIWEHRSSLLFDKQDYAGAKTAAEKCILEFYNNAFCHLSLTSALSGEGRDAEARKQNSIAIAVIDHLISEHDSVVTRIDKSNPKIALAARQQREVLLNLRNLAVHQLDSPSANASSAAGSK